MLGSAHPEILDRVKVLVIENDPITIGPGKDMGLRQGLTNAGFKSNCKEGYCFYEAWWRP